MVFGKHKKPMGPNAAARRLDAADGVMDGQYFGNKIVNRGKHGASVVPRPGPAPMVPYQGGRVSHPNYPGSSYGYGYGYGASAYPGYRQGYAGGAPAYGAVAMPAYGGMTSSAAALDAADGVIDGKFHGRPIVQGGAAYPAYGTTYGASYGAGYASAPAYGTTYGTSYPAAYGYGAAYPGYSSAASSALALDAADGVIDGKFNGRPIVQAGGYAAATPYYGAASYGTAYPTATAGYGATMTYPTASYGAGYPAYGAGYSPYNSTAAALDAADGVMDGRSFGRPIVQL